MNVEISYNPSQIELEQQELWAQDEIHKVTEDPNREKYFMVDMFPYPSGTGIHLGHVKNYVATDVQARLRTRQGQNVLHPMGYDSFGLPAENYALANGIHPKVAVERNVERFGAQLRRLGLAYDWDRQINTSDDEFVKWTQEGFLTLFDKGLVTEEHAPINWCGSCKTGLSNEDLDDCGGCERCGSEIERRLMRQWSVHITDYADKLLGGMSELGGWEPFLLDIQRNWIGKKEGWEVSLALKGKTGTGVDTKVFLDNPTDLITAQYLALSPEIAASIGVTRLVEEDNVKADIDNYINKNMYKRDKSRVQTDGRLLPGIFVTNPVSGQEMPVVVAEMVLQKENAGALLANTSSSEKFDKLAKCLGLSLSAMSDYLAGEHIDVDMLAESGILTPTTIYRLEDWVFSRQRFWGEPIPIVHCDDCGIVPVPRADLPILLPDVEKYEHTDTGESPLAAIEDWVHTDCPECSGPAQRETNTMPQWAGSSWYWHRYKDPHNQEALVGREADNYWGQVDMYVGGAEHAARHLIYARFWNRVMQEAGVVRDAEPFVKVQHLGLVMDENGVKISKRLGNGVDIDGLIATYGADSLRLAMMQAGEFSQQTNWNNREIISAKRFLDKIWKMQFDVDWATDAQPNDKLSREINDAIDKVSADIKEFKFNTAIATIRKLHNSILESPDKSSRTAYLTLLSILQPFAPHITEKIAQNNGHQGYLTKLAWPEKMTVSGDSVERQVVVMLNGKKIGVFSVSAVLEGTDEILGAVSSTSEKVAGMLSGGLVKKIIHPEGKNVINFVV